MKTKMSLSAEMDLTQDSVVQLTCWCGQIALHELWGLGRTRLDRITRRKELLGSQSLAVVMQPDKNGMPQTEKARRMRAEAIPKGVPTEFRVPALRTPRTRREQQLKMVGDRAETRMVRVYSCYGADGTLLGKGTAAELKDRGLFGSEGTVHECYRKRGGVYKPGGVTRMEMELCQKRIRHPMKLPDQPAKVKRKPIGGVIDPSALAYDVHDLMIYNEKARKIGKPELTYGYWAEKGKPATP